jgi:hypothetical protein
MKEYKIKLTKKEVKKFIAMGRDPIEIYEDPDSQSAIQKV